MPAAKQVTVGPDKPREKVDVAMVQIPNLTGYWDFYYAPAGSQQEQGPLVAPAARREDRHGCSGGVGNTHHHQL
jgi:hypothetical protein